MAQNMNGVSLVTLISTMSREAKSDGTKVDPREVSVTFDFTGVTHSQLQNVAARNIMIQLAGKTRAKVTRKEKPLSWNAAVSEVQGKTIKVAEFLKDTRSRKSPEKRRAEIVGAVAKMDQAAKQALIAELTKSLSKK